MVLPQGWTGSVGIFHNNIAFLLQHETDKAPNFLDDRISHYSQSKLELYSLFRVLNATKLWIIGAKKLVVKVDAQYIKGMLNKPDIHPNAAMNRWISVILMFDFELVHVPGAKHKGLDGLSRRRIAEDEGETGSEGVEEAEDWVDEVLGCGVWVAGSLTSSGAWVMVAGVKMCAGFIKNWYEYAPYIFWADRVTTQKSTGMTPYHAAHRVEPLHPFDITEATFLASSIMHHLSDSKLLAVCARMLQKHDKDLAKIHDKVLAARYASIHDFEKKNIN
ncbi:hypothetical protein AN958_01575 [Leucoagaricus sp. SymC.cos]|nr:hypothetical protein AN958_01575 [Leucoagaricus sp. SymC.cos]